MNTDTNAPFLAKVASYFTSLYISLFGAMTLQDFATITGIIFAVLTFAVNCIYQARDDKRKERETNARITEESQKADTASGK